jgi:enoyl-CoA hydratase
MDFTCADLSISHGIAEVKLAQTGKANRMGPDYWSQMPQLFAALDVDETVRVVIVRGEEHFSYGLDLATMAGDLAELLSPEGGAKGRTKLMGMIQQMQRANSAVAACRKPVIAALSGWCIGGGVDLATACDVRLASVDCKLSVREVKLAMVADVGTLARLPLIVGQGVTRELAFSGDDVDAARALRIGLVNEVYPDRAQLFAAARALAERIAKNPPLVVQGIKRVLNVSSERHAAVSLETVALWNSAFLPSKDLLEAIGAFMEKREPRFTGE